MPLADGQVQLTVDVFTRKQTHMVHLGTRRRNSTNNDMQTRESGLAKASGGRNGQHSTFSNKFTGFSFHPEPQRAPELQTSTKHKAGVTPLCSSESVSYLFEATVQVELPPVQMVGVEGEIVVFATIARVGQNITPALCKAQEDVTETKEIEEGDISG